jgi:iron(III) transport system substrate-binding protein
VWGSWSAAAGAETLVIYSGRGEQFTKPIIEAFQQKTGIAVQYQTADSAALLAKLREEGEKTPADVFITNYAGVLEQARQDGLLRPFNSPLLQQISSEYRAPDNSWVALSARTRVVVYNTNLINPKELTSLLDLADPKWKGKVATVSSANASFIGGISAMYSLLGAEKTEHFLRSLKENTAGLVFPGHTPIVSAVASGQVPLGYVNHYYYYRHKAKDPTAPIDILYLDQGKEGMGAAFTITGAAILKHAKHGQAAQQFLDFLLSAEGQKIFADVNYEYPINPEVPTNPAVKKRSEIQLAPVNLTVDVDNQKKVVTLIEQIGLE